LLIAGTVNSEISEGIEDTIKELTVMGNYKEFDEYYTYLNFRQADQADRELSSILDNFVKFGALRKEYTGIRFYDAQGTALINVVDRTVSYKTVDVSDARWFKESLKLKGGEAIVSEVYTSSEYPDPMLTISQPVYSNGKVKGVIGIDSRVEDLFSDLSSEKSIGEGGHAYLVGPSGRVLAHHYGTMVNEDVSRLHSTKRIFEGYRGIITEESDETPRVMMRKVYTPLKSANIGLVVEIPLYGVLAPVIKMRNTVLPVLLIGLALFTVAGFLLVSRITTPIEKLTGISSSMSAGNLDARADITSDDEIAELSSAFNQMAEDLKEYSGGLEKKVEERTEELENAFKELANSRMALLNMLEDLGEAKEHLERAYDELEGIDRMKSNIISNISHELKTPITIVLGILDLAIDEIEEESRNSLLKRGRSAMLRQARVVEDLVEASRFFKRTRELKHSTFDISATLKLTIGDLKSSAENKGIMIKTSIPNDISKVRADFSSIKHVMDNILDNAIKFTDSGGEIVISAKNKDGYVEVAVKDTGIGIPQKKMSKIFDRLYQIDSDESRMYSGTGMGLAVAKEIIEVNNGKIWVESKKGEGATFYFTLPSGDK
ncbi:MAG: ATP-binding protein, partial [Candidatus Hydrothermarchaeaceae archaeon]